MIRGAWAAFAVLAAVAANAEGDPGAGEKAFRICAACHQVGEGAKHRTGPILNGVVGGPVAAREGFRYSRALAALGEVGAVWSAEELDAFLADPRGYAKGTRMTLRGMKEPQQRADVIAYLATFSPPAAPAKDGFTVAPEVLAIPGDVEYGAYLAGECTTCHQADGTDDGIPRIVGIGAENFVTAMHAYRSQHRDHPVMQTIAGRLGDDEIASLAAYFETVEQ